MATTSKWCDVCDRYRAAVRPDVNHTFHLLMSLFTCGVWVIVWFLAVLAGGIGGWRCSRCGSRV